MEPPAILLIIGCLIALVHAHQQEVPYGSQQQQQPHMHQAPGQGQHAYQGGQQPQHGHGGHGQKQGNLLDKEHVQDREHIKEHLEGVISQPDTSKMSDEELQFHYFKMHDSDNNNKLDGSELIKSLIHWHVQEGHQHGQNTGETPAPPKIFTEEEMVELIDPILESDDTNKDGFIDYAEFVEAQKRVARPQNVAP